MSDGSPRHLAIAGGGTGGHVFPALAIAMEMKRIMPEVRVSYLGRKDSLEERLATRYGIPFYALPARPLQRRLSLTNFLIPFCLAQGVLKCRSLIAKEKIQAVLGTGGYVSVPALMGARLAKTKIFLQEQNSYPGLATRLFAKSAEVVFAAYPAVGKYLNRRTRIENVGNPLRPDFAVASKDAGLSFFGLSRDKSTLLVFGGSQGAQALNQKLKNVLPQLAKFKNIQIIWQVGKGNLPAYSGALTEQGLSGAVLEFIDRMELAYAAADLAFCRSGALSLSELAACGVPAILVPFPFAAEDHQYHNAKVFEDARAALLIRQVELEQYDLASRIIALFDDREKLHKMSEAAKSLADASASAKIAGKIVEVMKW